MTNLIINSKIMDYKVKFVDTFDFLEEIAKIHNYIFVIDKNVYSLYEKLIDKFETRKLVFKNTAINKNIKEGIMKTVEFELLWLKNKKRYYSRANVEDDK